MSRIEFVCPLSAHGARLELQLALAVALSGRRQTCELLDFESFVEGSIERWREHVRVELRLARLSDVAIVRCVRLDFFEWDAASIIAGVWADGLRL